MRLSRSPLIALLFALILFLRLHVIAQTSPPKEFHFEVLSIRPVEVSMGTPAGGRIGYTKPDPGGFDSQLTVWQMIMLAYNSPNQLTWHSMKVLNAPGWTGQFYRVAGKVSQADLRAWQSQTPDYELLRAAMRAALRGRCKLVIHEQPLKGEVFDLLVEKGGTRLKPALSPSARHLPGVARDRLFDAELPGGGVMAQTVENGRQAKTFYNATMKDLAGFLSPLSDGIPVRDKTGLTGRYDFAIKNVPVDPDENHIFSYPLKHLGLRVKRGLESRPALVIDHIEKPSPN